MESKKISFSFTKSTKKSLLEKPVPQEEKKVDYIECLDEKAIKVIGKEEEKKEPLVIPLLKSKTWHDRIINKINADIFQEKTKSKNNVSNIQQAVSNIQIKTEPPDENESILNEQAAKEIIEDLKSIEEKDKLSNLTLPLVKGQNLNGADESLLEDYDKVPIEDFGTAMLRGMGWKSGGGIGKNPKLVKTTVPELRPVGMGLGADKITLQKQQTGKSKKEEEELKVEKGSFIKIVVGKRANKYGQIEGFDDAGRLIVKMALNGNTISVNECIIQAVTKAEYLKNSKVLNAGKYEEYKNKEDTDKQKSSDYFNSNDASDSDACEKKRKHKKKDSDHKRRSKERQRYSSDSDSDNKRNRKRRRSGSSDRIKKSKKSKKHKEKDKERERRSDKECFNKRKSKKHKRSRSRSSSRR